MMNILENSKIVKIGLKCIASEYSVMYSLMKSVMLELKYHF